jgi:hypothetical protein
MSRGGESCRGEGRVHVPWASSREMPGPDGDKGTGRKGKAKRPGPLPLGLTESQPCIRPSVSNLPGLWCCRVRVDRVKARVPGGLERVLRH